MCLMCLQCQISPFLMMLYLIYDRIADGAINLWVNKMMFPQLERQRCPLYRIKALLSGKSSLESLFCQRRIFLITLEVTFKLAKYIGQSSFFKLGPPLSSQRRSLKCGINQGINQSCRVSVGD